MRNLGYRSAARLLVGVVAAGVCFGAVQSVSFLRSGRIASSASVPGEGPYLGAILERHLPPGSSVVLSGETAVPIFLRAESHEEDLERVRSFGLRALEVALFSSPVPVTVVPYDPFVSPGTAGRLASVSERVGRSRKFTYHVARTAAPLMGVFYREGDVYIAPLPPEEGRR